MKVADMIAARSSEWRELEADVAWLRGTASRRLDPDRTAAFARRYRSACSDLALATGMRFPESTLDYLQQLVADAHTQLYRIERFSILAWLRTLLLDVPRRTVTDPCTWIAAAVFVALFGGGMLAAVLRPGFAEEIVGEGAIMRVEEMYAERPDGEGFTAGRARMAGFYVFNNAGIGLRCFAGGILLGVGSLFVLAFNSLFLGTIFGHMLGSPVADHFAEFVTAHGPFELSAIVLSAGAGLRLGWSIVDTHGWSRADSLRRTAPQALATAGMATVLFILAAGIEAFVSPSPLPRWVKTAVAITSGSLLAAFLATGFLPRREARDAR